MKILFLLALLTIQASAQTAQFPGSVATDAQLGRAGNNVGTTLLSPQAATDTVAIVVSSAGIVPNMLISVGTTKPEIEMVCAVNGNTLTIGYNGSCPSITGRGFDSAGGGIAAAAHPLGNPVSVFNVAWYPNSRAKEIEAIETYLVSIHQTSNGPASWGSLTGSVNDYLRSGVGGFDQNQEWQGNGVPIVQALVGAVKSGGKGTVIGVGGYAMTMFSSADNSNVAVGVAGQGYVGADSSLGQSMNAWGAAFGVVNCGVAVCSDGLGHVANLVGLEVDATGYNDAIGRPAANITALQIAGSTTHQVGGSSQAINIAPLGTAAGIPWLIGLNSQDGAATTGLILGTQAATGASGGQILEFKSRDSMANTYTSEILTDSGGSMLLRAGSAAGQVGLQDYLGHTGLSLVPNSTTPYVAVNYNLTLNPGSTITPPTGSVLDGVHACGGGLHVNSVTYSQGLVTAQACS